ncbi:50S ribosomal protein L21e [Candidatus Woesearchaeota archaeon]|nr:50S ribosomal protein L21e [Candidatus Woesearchaeota archaeon]MBW2978602.1 50S ribosomal protein L21e [Candidatus Woesearchaeota archaeon]
MGRRKGTTRRKTRKLMTKHFRNKGKLSLTAFLKKYNVGDKVVIKPEPAYQKGICHLRFYGQKGIVKAKKGNCYSVQIKDKNKQKEVIVHPVHIKLLK